MERKGNWVYSKMVSGGMNGSKSRGVDVRLTFSDLNDKKGWVLARCYSVVHF